MTDTVSGQIVFIDDDDTVRIANKQGLQLAGYEVIDFDSAADALEFLDAGFAGIVVTDLRMPQIDGMEVFRRLSEMDRDLPVILITGHGDIDMAVAAMRDGAYDFIAKPYPMDRLLASIRRGLEKRRLVLENRALKAAAQGAADDLPLIGTSPAMARIRETLRQIADADVDVLILGETGTGKEVVASTLHRWSHRRAKQFVALNCGALPENVIESELFGYEAGAFTGAQRKRIGRIEYANGGTLFLDEVESMSPTLQVKLLRVLEAREIAPLGSNEVRPVDVRIVAATKIDLGHVSQRADFREDLYYRLNVVTIRIPPLRERRSDVPLLFAHFVERAELRFRRTAPLVTDNVRRYLLEHAWPGNVRELAHFADRFVLGLDETATVDVDGGSEPELSLPQRVEQYEAAVIRDALAAHAGDVKAVLDALSIPRKTFYDKLRRHDIEIKHYRKGQ